MPIRADSPFAPSRPDSLFHWIFLGVALSVVLAAMLLRISDDQVIMPVVNLPLPGVCTFKQLVGIGCPGCGLTRCFVSAAHGNLTAAWHFNPAGLLCFSVVVAQLPYRAWQLRQIRRGASEVQLGWFGHLLFWALFVSLIAQWVARFFVTL